MSTFVIYCIIFILLLALELGYFRIADRLNIIDRPNERSSHSTIVLRGGGIIFLLGLWIWSIFFGFPHIWFLLAVTLVAGVSFMDDIHSLPDSVRLVAQFAAMVLMIIELLLKARTFGLFTDANLVVMGIFTIVAMIVMVGASNIINFMDGINGITGAYAMASLIPLYLLNRELGFVEESLIITVALADIVFCIFNFRPKGKAKCFAGDVGSMGIAYILLFLIGCLIVKEQDLTYLIFLVVYGVDGCLTICHRIMLHEHLGEAHRKHAYQIMANELKIGHMKVSCLYAVLQLAISLGFIFLCPPSAKAHWCYLAGCVLALSFFYILFMRKYYHLHEEYLASLGK